MGGGNQEHHHEFVRLLVMSMQDVCLMTQGGEKNVDLGLQETTLVQQAFGGRLKSKAIYICMWINTEHHTTKYQ